MADTQIIPPQHDLDAKWDACLDLTVRRLVYSSSAGLLFFSQYHISFIHLFSEYAEGYDFNPKEILCAFLVSEMKAPDLSAIIFCYHSY